jgi:5-oxoprolinase (ATP-hydrolysing) subunit A
MSASICLNADLGELPGIEGRTIDAALLHVVTRCSIACGGHAGDAETMRITLREAKRRGVRVGAHPSFPDREHFGRRSLDLPADELTSTLTEQVAGLLAIAAEEGVSISHLKPHGALYNDAARDAKLARLVAGVTRGAGISELVGPPFSELERAAAAAGLAFVAEGFADRTYEPDGSLTPRSIAGAVIDDAEAVVRQAAGFAQHDRVTVRGGGELAWPVQTLCLHSDTPGAGAHAAALRRALEAAGVSIRP